MNLLLQFWNKGPNGMRVAVLGTRFESRFQILITDAPFGHLVLDPLLCLFCFLPERLLLFLQLCRKGFQFGLFNVMTISIRQSPQWPLPLHSFVGKGARNVRSEIDFQIFDQRFEALCIHSRQLVQKFMPFQLVMIDQNFAICIVRLSQNHFFQLSNFTGVVGDHDFVWFQIKWMPLISPIAVCSYVIRDFQSIAVV